MTPAFQILTEYLIWSTNLLQFYSKWASSNTWSTL